MGGSRIRVASLVAIALLVPSFVVAGTPAAETLSWSNATSPGGGPVQGLGGSSAVLVASTWSNGAYRSYDVGRHWERIPDFPPVSEARVEFDANDPLVGYVYGFGGVARTLDGGHTWQHILPTFVTYRLAVSPTGAVAATFRDADAYSHILVSHDRGDTWTNINFPTNGTRYMSFYGLQFGETDSHVVAMNIVSMWRTSDSGATWTKTSHQFLDLDRAPDGTLWGGGFTISKSVDSGATWQAVPAPDTGRPIVVGADGRLFVSGSDGFLSSADGGETWTELGEPEIAFGATQLVVDPEDPTAILAADEFVGVTRVSASGAEGRTTGLQPIEISALAASADGSVLLAGGEMGVYASRDGGDTWSHTGAGLGMNGVTAVAASPDGSVLMGGGSTRVFSPFIVASRDGGASWDTVNPNAGGDGRIMGIAIDPADPTRAYAAARMSLANSKLLETTNGGASWRIVLSLPVKIHDVAWDAAVGKPLVATEIGTLVYERPDVWTPRAVGRDTLTVAAEAGRSWSNGAISSIWSSAGGLPHTPWAHSGSAVVDLAPEDGSTVWAAHGSGTLARCVADACTDVSPPATTRASLVKDGRAFAATTDGIYRAQLN